MAEQNLRVLLAARPQGLPEAGDFELERRPIRDPEDGEVRLENLYLSLDPAMRGWMSDRKSYVPPIGLGELMRGMTVGRVTASRHSGIEAGDRVIGATGWQSHPTVRGKHLRKLPDDVPSTLALSAMGMTGFTAYFGLLDVGKPKAGETVLVSGGAGAVGSVVGQIAKIHGCRAVGIAGSDEKCRWITEDLGFDAAINYKTADLHRKIRDTCPDGVDIYFDNVGGETLDTVLRSINLGARILICGAISQYNATEPVPGPSNYLSLLVHRARMEGFLVTDYESRYLEAWNALGGWISEGRIKSREDVVDGLENAPRALLRLFDGSNSGKLLVRISGG